LQEHINHRLLFEPNPPPSYGIVILEKAIDNALAKFNENETLLSDIRPEIEERYYPQPLSSQVVENPPGIYTAHQPFPPDPDFSGDYGSYQVGHHNSAMGNSLLALNGGGHAPVNGLQNEAVNSSGNAAPNNEEGNAGYTLSASVDDTHLPPLNEPLENEDDDVSEFSDAFPDAHYLSPRPAVAVSNSSATNGAQAFTNGSSQHQAASQFFDQDAPVPMHPGTPYQNAQSPANDPLARYAWSPAYDEDAAPVTQHSPSPPASPERLIDDSIPTPGDSRSYANDILRIFPGYDWQTPLNRPLPDMGYWPPSDHDGDVFFCQLPDPVLGHIASKQSVPLL
jgi:hypothetical protein